MPIVTFGGFGATTTQVQAGPVVPAADSANNIGSRDVVGNKSDAAVTTVGVVASIIAYIKGILNSIVLPAANSAANTNIAQVVGNKTDTGVLNPDGVTSLIAYIKGAMTLFLVSSVDTVANGFISEALGNKIDAAQTTVGITRSIMAYVKGLLNQTVNVFKGGSSFEQGTDSTATSGTYRQLVASTAARVRSIYFNGSMDNPNTNETASIVLATGAAASEVNIIPIQRRWAAKTALEDQLSYEFDASMAVDIPAGTRISWRPTFVGTINTIVVGYSLGEQT